jgi:hypothetical protein
MLFWAVTLCRLVGRYQRFGETHFRAEVAMLGSGYYIFIYMMVAETKHPAPATNRTLVVRAVVSHCRFTANIWRISSVGKTLLTRVLTTIILLLFRTGNAAEKLSIFLKKEFFVLFYERV